MVRSNVFTKTVQLIVCTILLAMGLRTWVVMGLVAPVTVSGSSMVPTLRGEFITAHCPRCEKPFDVGGEFAAQTAFATCPCCAEPLVPLAALPFSAGERLCLDRTAFKWRTPRRWEVAVLLCPHDAEQLCVKRVVGLPGESIQLLHGDVFVNDRVLRKSLAEQLVMRQSVYVAEEDRSRWQNRNATAWQWIEGGWQCQDVEENAARWLRYTHLQKTPVTDDSSYNAGVSRRLNWVRDFMLCAKLHMEGKGTLMLEIDDGREVSRVSIQPAKGTVGYEVAGNVLKSGQLSIPVCDRLFAGEPVELVFSNFDRQLLLALDGQVVLKCLQSEEKLPPAGSVSPVAVGAWGGEVSLEELTLYRDVYYGRPAGEVQRLESGEYYLLGDNAPISVDSRRWGPVPGRLLLGKPLGVR